MDPGVSHLQAFLASVGIRGDVIYLIEMGTNRCHVTSIIRRLDPQHAQEGKASR